MKKTILISLLIFFVLSNYCIFAQKLKVGHVNSSELLSNMPGRDAAQKELIEYATSLEEQLKLMTNELETKYQDYLANETRMTELIKQTKQRELTQLQSRIQEFQESAQEDLQKKETQLIEPLLKKAQDAIQKVAKEKGYTYILDTSSGSVLYFEDTDDILMFVKKELGIQ
jgi:outer membrane protein